MLVGLRGVGGCIGQCREEVMSKTKYDPHWEERIVWLDDTAKQLPYLREVTMKPSSRTGAPGKSPRRVVAYATLRAEAVSKHGQFERRVWYVTPNDPVLGEWPAEAVDTDSIVAGHYAWKRRRGEP